MNTCGTCDFFSAYQKVSSFLPTSGLQGISVSANLPTATIANLQFYLKNISMVIYLTEAGAYPQLPTQPKFF